MFRNQGDMLEYQNKCAYLEEIKGRRYNIHMPF